MASLRRGDGVLLGDADVKQRPEAFVEGEQPGRLGMAAVMATTRGARRPADGVGRGGVRPQLRRQSCMVRSSPARRGVAALRVRRDDLGVQLRRAQGPLGPSMSGRRRDPVPHAQLLKRRAAPHLGTAALVASGPRPAVRQRGGAGGALRRAAGSQWVERSRAGLSPSREIVGAYERPLSLRMMMPCRCGCCSGPRGHAAGHGAVADHGDDPPALTQLLSWPPPGRRRTGRSGVAVLDPVVRGLFPGGMAQGGRQPAHRAELALASGGDLVDVGLVAGVRWDMSSGESNTRCRAMVSSTAPRVGRVRCRPRPRR
jgi:hypothetical protein